MDEASIVFAELKEDTLITLDDLFKIFHKKTKKSMASFYLFIRSLKMLGYLEETNTKNTFFLKIKKIKEGFK